MGTETIASSGFDSRIVKTVLPLLLPSLFIYFETFCYHCFSSRTTKHITQAKTSCFFFQLFTTEICIVSGDPKACSCKMGIFFLNILEFVYTVLGHGFKYLIT